MARPFEGKEHLEAARALRDQAKTKQDYRQALAVLLPLEQHLSLEETGEILGLSKGATSRIRNQFLAREEGRPKKASWYVKVLPERRAREAAILDEVLAKAAKGGVVVVPPLKQKVEEKLGQTICLATLYNLLHRHGFRKLAPDTRHPKGDEKARDDWKKNSPPNWQTSL
jgi:transposase